MRFEVINENGVWSIYFCSDTDRRYVGQANDIEAANLAVQKLSKTWGLTTKSRHDGLNSVTHRALNKLTPKRLQVTAMSLDPVRAWKFYEELLMLSHTLHMMANSFDEVDFFFSGCLDQSTREHFKIATRHITALLDAVYASQIQGDTDDYLAVIDKALYVKERITPFIAHVLAHSEDNKWRLDELDRVLDNIMPDSWLSEQRERVAQSIINSLRNHHNND